MSKPLLQFSLIEDADVWLVHSIARQLAESCGLKLGEQIDFAARVSGSCGELYPTHNVCFFSGIELKEQRFLEVTFLDCEERIVQEVPKMISYEDASRIRSQADELWHSNFGYKRLEHFNLALAHELKNSIAKIDMAITLAGMAKMSPDLKTYIQIINRASARLKDTMVRLNEVNWLRHSSSLIKDISVEEIFNNVCDEYKGELFAINAQLRSDFHETTISYIEIFLRTIFANLLNNAIKYAQDGRQLQVVVTSVRKEDLFEIRFQDNGQGIDLKKSRSKLFEPFVRLSSAGEGTGLGLYLIKGIVERNGGTIDIESEPGKGTTFIVTLQPYKGVNEVSRSGGP